MDVETAGVTGAGGEVVESVRFHLDTKLLNAPADWAGGGGGGDLVQVACDWEDGLTTGVPELALDTTGGAGSDDGAAGVGALDQNPRPHPLRLDTEAECA